MTLFQAVFAPLCGCAAAAMLLRAARGRSARRNASFWFAVWLTAGFLILFPAVTTRIARLLGIGRGADLLLYVAILAGLAAAFYFYVKHRRLEVMVTEILRRETLGSAVKGIPARQPNGGQPESARSVAAGRSPASGIRRR